ncbi:cache domain-containing sensor histidine kinase [Paenibacillus ferrarius]|uniref:cache domain-containing sensor histidine kinase n=1 Tax=Paenibacillus ferrarius TaxID=1469647 RepID=UPI003D2E3BBA
MMSPFFGFLTRSFYIKMILVMLAVSLIPLIVLSYISVTVSSSTVESQVNRLNAQLVNQVVDRIELTMSRFRELSEQYSRISSIQSALVSPSSQYYEEVVRKKDLIAVLSTASAVIGNVEGLQVYSAATDEVLSSDEAPSTLEGSKFRPLIEEFLSKGGSSLFLDKSTHPNVPILQNSTYYIARIPFDTFEDLRGVLLISMNNTQFQRQIENIQLGSLGSVSLLTPSGVTIATTSKLERSRDDARTRSILSRWAELGKPNQLEMGTSIVSVKQTKTFDSWIVISEIPSQELTRSAEIIRRTVTYFLIALVIIGGLSVIGFGYQLYRPLQAVKRQVDAIKKGNFEARVTHFAPNEIGDLGRMLNTMAVRIQELLSEQQESEDMKRKLEIRALQSQINPHFMYNTLNTIRMFAMLKDYDNINTLMGKFVSLLRYSMENYDQHVQLQQELEYVQDYIALLNMRYKYQTQLHAEIEAPLERMSIPKLGLQPLIENAVFHGILPKKMPEGHIYLRVYSLEGAEPAAVIIEVEDNGVGLDEGQLEKLRIHLQQEQLGDNIGLKNVWLRMKLMFGKEAQIELGTAASGGLLIRFVLPADTVRLKEVQHG